MVLALDPSTSKGEPKGKGKTKGDPEVDIVVPSKGTNMKSVLVALLTITLTFLLATRNLFAIDYCKTNTVTKAVFEQAWKNLSKDMKQVRFHRVFRAQAELVNYSTTKHSAQRRRRVQRKLWLR